MKYEEIVKKIEGLKSRVKWKKSDLVETENDLEMAEDYLDKMIDKGRK